jgi:hypothetical protein
MPPIDPNQQGKDLKDFQKLPRSPLASYMMRASEFRNTLAAFEPTAIFQWVTEYLGNRIGRRHKFNHYDNSSPDSGIYQLADDSSIGGAHDPKREIRMSIAGDWGTGTDEAAEVAAMMQKFAPHFTVHLGDVYYVGKKDEVEENCLGQPDPDHTFTPVNWPVGSVGSFALNGNHEMYALGTAYFDVFLPTLGLRPSPNANPLGQKASYFCLQNEFWRVIALDTGYNSIGIPILEYIFMPSCKLRKEELQWLRDKINPAGDKRGIVLLTHHQYFSSFDTEYPSAARQLSEFIHRPVLWLWGHEHRMAVYGKFQQKNGIQAFGRCIGHGGMPVEINPKFKRTDRPLVAFDNRQYPTSEDIVVGYNGFANLTFNANQLKIEYRDLKDNLLLVEHWQVNDGVLSGIAAAGPKLPGLTQHQPLAAATE